MRLIRWVMNECRYAVAAARWEGWGAPGDPRSRRSSLLRDVWVGGGFPPEPL